MKRLLRDNQGVLCTVFFITFTLFFYAPLEVYLQNRNEFWCDLRMIWWIPTVVGLTSFIIFSVIGILIRKEKLKHIYAVLAFAGGFCAYIQGNFLNMKLGLMDGRKIDWHSLQPKFRLNLLLWLVIILVFLALTIWKNKIMETICRYLAVLLVITQTVALVTLVIPAISEGGLSKKEKDFCSMDYLYEVGDEENIIVLVLDSFDQNYLGKLIEEDNPELRKLDGFTYFSNYSGLFRSTAYGIPPLLTGATYINQKPYDEWLEDLAQKGTFYDDLLKQNFSIDIYMDSMPLLPGGIQEKVRNRQVAPIVMDGVRLKAAELIYRLVGCKYLPDYFKCKIWLYGSEFEGFERYNSEHEVYDWYNKAFRDGLDQNGITVKNGKQYKFIHLYGAHEPYFTDRDLQDVPENWNVEDIPQGAIKIATKYIEELKKAGVYEQSTIIVVSDHGSTHVPGIVSNSILLVKKKGERGPLAINNAPVSAADYGATLVDLVGGDTEYNGEISAYKIPENAERERKYYAYLYTDAHTIYNDGLYALLEYNVNSKDCSTPLFELSGIGILPNGRQYNHADYCETCKNGIKPENENNWMYWEHIATDNLPKE